MGLLQNGYRDAVGGGMRFSGATLSNGANPTSLVANRWRTGATRNLTAGQGLTDDTVGIPYGYRVGGAWLLPQKPGALAAHNLILGEGDIADLNLAGGVNGTCTIAGVGDLTGTGALIVSLLAALSGSGTISSAVTQAFLNLAAALSGSGTLAGLLTALGNAEAALTASGTVASTTAATALGTLAAEINVTGDVLTSANVGAAVWREIIENGYTAEQILRILAAFAAGDATGLENGSPSFTGIDNTTTRIAGTYSTGTRNVTTLDGD